MSVTRSWFTLRDESEVLFPFLQVVGSPVIREQKLLRVVREGVEGVGYLRLPLRGEPFRLGTSVDLANVDHLGATGQAYKNARGMVLDFYWQGLFFGHVMVLSVQPRRWRRISGTVGGVTDGSTIMLPAVWVLETVG